MSRRGRAARAVRDLVRGTASLAVILPILSGFSLSPADAGIVFAGPGPVPRSVQEFAWHVIETHCQYQGYERRERSFWASDIRRSRTATGMGYAMTIVSDVSWKKTEPPAFIEMTVVDDDGPRLTALTSSFIRCGL
jgi:hypothetical protein